MAVVKTFREFEPEELESHKDLLLRRAEEIMKIETEMKGMAEKAEWLKNNLCDLLRKIGEGGIWI